MSKSIKVSEEVYQTLLEMQCPRETFSEEVARLLKMYELLTAAVPLIRSERLLVEYREG